MKKVLSLILVLLIAFSVLAACSSDNIQTETPTEGQSDINLYGQQVKIAQFNSNTLGDGNPLLYVKDSPLADAALKRLDEIGKKLNCSISIDYYNKDGGGLSLITSAVINMMPICDLIFTGNADVTVNLCKGKAFSPIMDYNDIIGYGPDTFETYGYPNLLEQAMYDGILYSVAPYAHPNRQLKSGQFFAVKTDLVKEYNDGLDVRELYETGGWNWDNFESIIANTNFSESGEVKLFSAGLSEGSLVEYAAYSNGFKRVTRNLDGSYVAGYDTLNTTQAMEWAINIVKQYDDVLKFEARSNLVRDFEGGYTAMIFLPPEWFQNLVAYGVGEFSVLPFPMGPMGTLETMQVEARFEGFGMYRFTEVPEGVAYIIKEYCKPFEGYPTIQDALAYQLNTFWDERDIQTMFQIEKNARFSYYNLGGGSVTSGMGNNIRSMTPQECIQKYGPTLDNCIDKYISANSQGIDKLKSGS